MTDLFDDNDLTPSPVDPNKDYFAELVGDGKRYKTPVDAGRAIVEKDAFIDQLKAELSGLRDELRGRERLEEIAARLTKPTEPPVEDEQTPPAGDAPTSMKPEALDQMIEKRLAEREESVRRQTNLNNVQRRLAQEYGPDFKRTLAETAQKLSLGPKTLTDLAAHSPDAFFQLIGSPKPKQQDVLPPPPNLNASGFAPSLPSGAKTYKEWEEVRKTMRASEYWSPAVQNRIHSDRDTLGPEKFYA